MPSRPSVSVFPILSAVAGVALSGCAGVGASYDTPAPDRQIPVTVEAITPALVVERSQKPEAEFGNEFPGQGTGPYVYRLGPGDVLSIFINQPLFRGVAAAAQDTSTGTEALYVISESGQIFLPFHGALSVGGLSVSQAFELIRNALARFINDPQINVRVAEFRSQRVAVVGEVASAGYQPITDRPLSLPEALVVAGWTEESNLRNVALKRDNQEYVIDAKRLLASPSFGQHLTLSGGDVIVVPKNEDQVYVLGEAPNRISPIFEGDTSLASVLFGGGGSGGSSRQGKNYLQEGAAALGSIFVIRGTQDGAVAYHLNAKSPDAVLLADRFMVQDGDVVFVSTRSVTRFNRFFSQILPSIQTLIAPLFIANQVEGAIR